jgi:hypothetical protein
MTTAQAIQREIRTCKVELNIARKVICTNAIQKLHVNGTIKHYRKKLKELTFSLNCAILQEL